MLGEIWKKYKMCRESAGYTQEAVAEKLSIGVRSIAAYESGERQAPDDIVAGMAKIYNAPLLAYQHLKATSVLKDYLPELDTLHTHGDMAFQLALVEDEIKGIYEITKDILRDGFVSEKEKPDWDTNNKRIKDIVGKLLSVLAFSKRVDLEGCS